MLLKFHLNNELDLSKWETIDELKFETRKLTFNKLDIQKHTTMCVFVPIEAVRIYTRKGFYKPTKEIIVKYFPKVKRITDSLNFIWTNDSTWSVNNEIKFNIEESRPLRESFMFWERLRLITELRRPCQKHIANIHRKKAESQ